MSLLLLSGIAALALASKKPAKPQIKQMQFRDRQTNEPVTRNVAIIGPEQQQQLCQIADAEFKVVSKLAPIPPSVKLAWDTMSCKEKAALVAGTTGVGVFASTGILLAYMAEDEQFSERFRQLRVKTLKAAGLHGIAKQFAQATNPVYERTSSFTVETAKAVNKLFP